MTINPNHSTVLTELAAIADGQPVAIVEAPVHATEVLPYIATKRPVYIDLSSAESGTSATVLRAYVGGPRTGLYERTRLPAPVTLENGEVHEWSEKRLIPWVAVRTRAYTEVVIKDGQFAETGVALFDVLVISPTGSRTIRRMSANDAANIGKVLDSAATLGLPEPEVFHTTAVRNMLRTLGATEAPLETEVLTGGWVDIDGHAAFIEPMGTTYATHISDDYRVKVEGADRWMGSTGASIENAAETLAAWFAITPNRPDLAVATLSTIMASVLGLKRRTTLYIAAQPESGKTVLLGNMMTWSNDPRRDSEMSMSMESDDTASVPAIYARMSIVAGTPYFDDLLYSDRSAFGRINAISRGGYLSSVRSKSANDGREREQVYGSTSALPVVSAEAIPENAQTRSIVGRMVICQLRVGDVEISDVNGRQNAVDAWRERHATNANHLRGAFVQWLASRADHIGGTEQLREWVQTRRQAAASHLGDGRMNRQLEVTSVLRTGWDVFREFLDENDVVLPLSDKEIEEAFSTLLENAQQNSVDANPIRRMLEHIRDSTSDGYFTNALDDGVPFADRKPGPGPLGWIRDSNNGWAKKGGQHFGYVTDTHVLLLPAALKWASRTYDASRALPLNNAQVGAGLDELVNDGVVVEHTWTTKAKTGLPYGFDRRRGVILPVEFITGVEPDAANESEVF